MTKLELKNVSFVYNKGTAMEKAALNDVSCAIRENAVTGIIGHTGSGKSTLIQLLNGLCKPTDGQVLLDGVALDVKPKDFYNAHKEDDAYRTFTKREALKRIKKELKERKKNLCFKVGLVMQYPEYQLFEETVEKDIAFGPSNMGLDEEEIKERVKEAAAFVGLDEGLMTKNPFDLSGGQKRRVALAGIIAMRPEVLVLDEPAAGLDPRGRKTIFEGIVHYQKETGATVVIVSHSMEDMAKYADDIIVLDHGAKIAEGSKDEVFSHVDTLVQTGLSAPQISTLMQLLRAGGMPIPEGIYTVENGIDVLQKLFEEVTK